MTGNGARANSGVASAVTLLLTLASCGTEPEPRQTEVLAAAAGSARFADVSTEVGIDLPHRRSWSSTWQDYDGDGWPDLFVNRHFHPPFLYRNEGGSFTRVNMSWEEHMDRHTCIWGEATGDGLVDLFCGQGAHKGRGRGPNALYVQDLNGSLTDQAKSLGVDNPRGRQRSANWLDHDSDGDLDLFVGNALRRGFPNLLFVNRRSTFVERSKGLAQKLKTEASSWADWDNDGDPDLLVTQTDRQTLAYRNKGGFFRRVDLRWVTGRDWTSGSWGDFDGDGWIDLHLANEQRSVLFRNVRGRFRPVHRMRGAENRASVFFDVDNDGDLDVFVVRGAPGLGDVSAVDRRDLLLVNTPSGFKVEKIRASGPRDGNGDDAVAADYDRDGGVDLFVTNGYKRSNGPFVLLRNVGEVGNWAGIDLQGSPRNPQGIGTRLKVDIGVSTYQQHVTDGVSFRGQSEIGYVHLGLGSASSAQVVVKWPRGTRDCLEVTAGEATGLAMGSRPCSTTAEAGAP